MTTQKRLAKYIEFYYNKDNVLWGATSGERPERLDTDIYDWLSNLDLDKFSYIRTIGTRNQARHLISIATLCDTLDHPLAIQLAGPEVCTAHKELHDGNIVIHRMRQCFKPGSLGGWHTFNCDDLHSYGLIAAKDEGIDISLDMLKKHPAFPAYSFIKQDTFDLFTELIANICDPRWFIDAVNPYRTAKIKSYFGLNPKVMHDVLNGDLPTKQHKRCALVRQAWGGASPRPVDTFEPCNFLYRQSHNPDTTVGQLRISQIFLAYIYRVWHHNILLNTAYPVKIFDPNILFNCEQDIAAYKNHNLQVI